MSGGTPIFRNFAFLLVAMTGLLLQSCSVEIRSARRADSTHAATSTTAKLITQLSVGYNHVCVLFDNADVKCWGNNDYGQLGDGSSLPTTYPVLANTGSGVTSLALGLRSSCALYNDGTVKCWGDNGSGQLGNGSFAQALTPTPVTGLTNVTQISASQNFYCALKSDGTIQCWGDDSFGQFGDGTYGGSATPVTVSGISDAIRISASSNTVCAELIDSSVKCWGYALSGTTGNGIYVTSNSPNTSTGLTNINLLNGSAFGSHFCARDTTNSVSCWGENGYGQLGDGTYISSPVPISLTGLPSIRELALGSYSTCALTASGSVWCLGANFASQLGNGNFTDQLSWIQVTGIANASRIGMSYDFGCAQTDDIEVKCWGSNYSGQFGNGVQNAYDTASTATQVQKLTEDDIYQIVFLTVPSSETVNTVFSVSTQVAIKNRQGTVLPLALNFTVQAYADDRCSISPQGGASLSGTTTVPSSSGVATFSDLQMSGGVQST